MMLHERLAAGRERLVAAGISPGEAAATQPPVTPATPSPEAETGPEPDGDRVSGADLDDSDFDRLLDELAGTGGGTPSAAPYTSAPTGAEAPTTPSTDDQVPAPNRADGDVSEFLRELSRLAVDDPDDTGRPAPSSKPPRSDAQQAADAAADARRPGADADDDDDRSRRRGLFGRKR